MNFKHWPPASPKTASRGGYWVKGALAALGTGLGLYAVALLLNQLHATAAAGYIVAVLTYFPMQVGENLVPLFCTLPPDPFLDCLGTGLIIIGLLTLIEFLVIGAFVGHLYGKSKNRKQII